LQDKLCCFALKTQQLPSIRFYETF